MSYQLGWWLNTLIKIALPDLLVPHCSFVTLIYSLVLRMVAWKKSLKNVWIPFILIPR